MSFFSIFSVLWLLFLEARFKPRASLRLSTSSPAELHPDTWCVAEQQMLKTLVWQHAHPSIPHPLLSAWCTLLQFIFPQNNTGRFTQQSVSASQVTKTVVLPMLWEGHRPSLIFSSLSPCSVFSVCLLHSYESSAVILPHTPRLTHFPTVSGSPASLADSMQQKLAGPRRRRPQNPSAM